jgi:hypothetical protein
MGGKSCYSNCLYGLRRWQHIVAVKRGKAMQLYHDGKKVAEAVDKSRLPHAFYLAIGQHFCSNLAVGQYAFVGQLDELAIYGRALRMDEIVRHYEIIHSVQHKPSDI